MSRVLILQTLWCLKTATSCQLLRRSKYVGRVIFLEYLHDNMQDEVATAAKGRISWRLLQGDKVVVCINYMVRRAINGTFFGNWMLFGLGVVTRWSVSWYWQHKLVFEVKRFFYTSNLQQKETWIIEQKAIQPCNRIVHSKCANNFFTLINFSTFHHLRRAESFEWNNWNKEIDLV